MDWHESVEQLLQKYCDESQVREALHRQAYYKYKRQLTCFQLPIIILSAISGSMQFLSKSFPTVESHIVTATGGLSILVSIISSVMTYLKLGERHQANMHAQMQWQSFYNSIKHELSLAPALRADPHEFEQFARVLGPLLPQWIPASTRVWAGL